MAPTYERYQAAEAHLAMVEVLLKAAIYRDFVGDWPDTSEILDQFSGGSLPRDPFTGEHVEYDLRGTLPRVQVDAPRNVKATAVADINLRGRVEADAEALAGMIRDLQRRQRMEEAADKKARAESNTKEAQNSSRGSRLRGRR